MYKALDTKFVAFFDILGFKNLVEKNSHEDLIKIYNDALCDTVNKIREIGIEHHNYDKTAVESLESISQFIISDSIILIQNEFNHRGLFFLILQSRVLLRMGINEGIPLRGAISLGEISVLENLGTTIVGRGLTNAYQMESIQNWSGAIIDPNCFKIHPNDISFINILTKSDKPLLIEYDVPLKAFYEDNFFAINWVDKSDSIDDIRNAFYSHKKEIESPKQEEIINNTLQFAKYIKGIVRSNTDPT
ncbi:MULTISPECIES: hypothetical protein [unclassified Sphingobacterium]|uniref:hypothetical protein n=1 Tax=unclassified Sphingobacterium TaxID=2609468 RepID=UPI0025DCB74F|nr:MULTISPECIES: hypothetical protein [unclassified Sphingobacterium]